MGATGDAEQPRGPGGAERGGPELGDAGAAGQLVLTVRVPRGRSGGLGSGRQGLGFPGPQPAGKRTRRLELPPIGGGGRFSHSDDQDSSSGAALRAR